MTDKPLICCAWGCDRPAVARQTANDDTPNAPFCERCLDQGAPWVTVVDEIVTDDRGVPYVAPERADFASDVDYLRAFHAFKDRMTNDANKAFDEAFRAALKRTK